MGFFKKKNKNIITRDFGVAFDKTNWFQVFSASLGRVMANQEACSELVVKGQNWNVDLSRGTLSFGSDSYPVQFIGSESSVSNSWLWGWDNVNHFPEKVVTLANKIKEIGEEWGLEPLTINQFDLSETFTGHALAIVTCGLNPENSCYYRGPHDQGAVLLGFSNVPEAVFAPIDNLKFTRISMECVQNFQVDHKIFIESFLYQNNTPYEWDGLCINAHFEQDIKIEFEEIDEFLRIKRIKTL